MIVVLIIGVLAGIAVPQWIKARTSSRKSACVSNLKRIESAKEQWAMETKKLDGAACDMTDLVPAYVKTTPSCPTAGTYTVGAVGTTAVCTVAGHALP